VVPILGVVVCFAMMASLDVMTWYRLVVWLVIGLLIYFFYSRKHSHLRPAQTEAASLMAEDVRRKPRPAES
jgi:APA family basic amino acid/polyamine antiporter